MNRRPRKSTYLNKLGCLRATYPYGDNFSVASLIMTTEVRDGYAARILVCRLSDNVFKKGASGAPAWVG